MLCDVMLGHHDWYLLVHKCKLGHPHSLLCFLRYCFYSKNHNSGVWAKDGNLVQADGLNIWHQEKDVIGHSKYVIGHSNHIKLVYSKLGNSAILPSFCGPYFSLKKTVGVLSIQTLWRRRNKLSYIMCFNPNSQKNNKIWYKSWKLPSIVAKQIFLKIVIDTSQ